MVRPRLRDTPETGVPAGSRGRHPVRSKRGQWFRTGPAVEVLGAGIDWTLCLPPETKDTTRTRVQDSPGETKDGQILEDKSVKSNGQ